MARVSAAACSSCSAVRLPPGRRYGVAAGVGRILDSLADFRFGPHELAFLAQRGVVDEPTLEWLADYRFRGSIWGYPEGELFFAYSPLMIVESTFAEAVVLETWLLSVLNHDSAIAAAASRMVNAAAERPLIEMGGRRTHEQAAVAAARASYIAGFEGTSNLEAGRRYGIPTRGTSAHAFTLVHDSEEEAFASQVANLGSGTTLLIDTYDTERGAVRAVEAAGAGLGGVRLDSGDLGAHARSVRALLDERGATATRILATGDLDEYGCRDLAGAPIDAYGIGTRLVTGSGVPTAELVYKLVARATEPGPEAVLHPVWKSSEAKATVGGRKAAYRMLDNGVATTELLIVDQQQPPAPDTDGRRSLLVPMVLDGELVASADLDAARARHRRSLAELPADAMLIDPGEAGDPDRAPLTARATCPENSAGRRSMKLCRPSAASRLARIAGSPSRKVLRRRPDPLARGDAGVCQRGLHPQRGHLCDPSRELHRPLQLAARFGDLLHQPDAQRLVRAELVGRQQVAHRVAPAQGLRGAERCSTERHDPAADLKLAEPDVRRRRRRCRTPAPARSTRCRRSPARPSRSACSPQEPTARTGPPSSSRLAPGVPP